MHCAVHADARTTPLPLPSLVRHPFPLSLRSLSLFLARGLVTHLFLDPLFSSIPRVCLPNSLFHRVFPASSSLCAFLPAAVFPPLSLSLSIRVYALFTRRFSPFSIYRSFLDRRQLLSLSQSRSISVVTRDSLSISLCVCHSLAVFPPLPPMRIGSPFFEFRGTTHAWYRHRRGTFLDFRLRLRWAGRERAPARFFDTLPPRRCVE